MEIQEVRKRRMNRNRQMMCAGLIVYLLAQIGVHNNWLSDIIGFPIAVIGLLVGVIFGIASALDFRLYR